MALKTPLTLALLAATGLSALAQEGATQTLAGASAPIARVTLYPGVAAVERVARVEAGTRQLVIDCLPASLDQQSLQLSADAGVRLGDYKVQLQTRDLASKACTSPLEQKIRSLEDKLAALNADEAAARLVNDYLKALAHPSEEGKSAPAATQISPTVEALRASSRGNALRAHQTLREKEALQEELKPLLVERERTGDESSQVMKLTLQLATHAPAQVRLAYQVRGPSWQPIYRAQLDSAKNQIVLERQALVTQASGEDWSQVQLLLSTGQPTRATQGRLPRLWTLDVERPRAVAMASAPAPAPMVEMRASAKARSSAPGLPELDVSSLETAYATQFSVPYKISVPTSSERMTLSLGSQNLQAKLLTRTAPHAEEAAYLVAQLSAPAGVWPAGIVALFRDNAFVGRGRLDFGDAKEIANGLSFGRDDKVVVRNLPADSATESKGLLGSSSERQITRRYQVENRHDRAIELQVVDAAPVSRNDKIRVQSQYSPEPATLRFGEQNGMLAWQQSLAAGASASFEARHQIRHPDDLAVDERQ
ncbi:DUF4139 domain-containing protein [Comamonas composti]|uniref:DUF4139 domain-containing protein n=1 Tax=Comamonas composti TaxID=408558 RepID=UPI00040360C4|nr:DUF4139 domain-containing protein [Comamonas composti]